MTRFQNLGVSATRHANQDPVDEFDSFNPESTREGEIKLPGEGRQTVELEKPLIVAMARENKYDLRRDDEGKRQSVDAVFDEALCDVTETTLQAEGLTEAPVDTEKLRALMIKRVRRLSFGELADHIAGYSEKDFERLGLQQRYHQSTYRKAEHRLNDGGHWESVVDASYVAVHLLFGAGVPIPAGVRKRYDLSYYAGPAGRDFAVEARDVALYTLVDELLEIVVERLEFNRGSNASRELWSVLGAFAYAAASGNSIEEYNQPAHHVFDTTNTITGPTIRRCIDKLDRFEVEDMFKQIYEALLVYVLGSGVISEPVRIAYDLVNLDSLGSEPFDGVFVTDDGRWRFAALSLVDSELEFGYGLRLLKSESHRAGELSNLLRALDSVVDVELLLLDRGFDGADDIDVCEKFVPERWAIHAQEKSGSSAAAADYEKLKDELEPGATAVVSEAGFNQLNKPVQLLGHSGAARDSDSLAPYRAFWSTILLSDDVEDPDKRIRKLNSQYDQRAKIETQFRLTKNKFDVATDSEEPHRKLFYYSMSTLFYDLYKIVNTVPSPERGLEFDVGQQDFLEAIQLLSLGPSRSDAFQHVETNV